MRPLTVCASFTKKRSVRLANLETKTKTFDYQLTIDCLKSYYNSYEYLKKNMHQKTNLKNLLKVMGSDEFVRDSVLKTKHKEMQKLSEGNRTIANKSLKMINQMSRADWTGNEMGKTAYSFYKSYVLLTNKLKTFNGFTKCIEVLKYFSLLMNICITYGKLYLLPKYQSLVCKCRLFLFR